MVVIVFHQLYVDSLSTIMLLRSVLSMRSSPLIILYPSRGTVVAFGVRPNELFCAKYGWVTAKSTLHTLSISVPTSWLFHKQYLYATLSNTILYSPKTLFTKSFEFISNFPNAWVSDRHH